MLMLSDLYAIATHLYGTISLPAVSEELLLRPNVPTSHLAELFHEDKGQNGMRPSAVSKRCSTDVSRRLSANPTA
jgi:hypothetical protein